MPLLQALQLVEIISDREERYPLLAHGTDLTQQLLEALGSSLSNTEGDIHLNTSLDPNIPSLAPDLCGRAEQTKRMRKFLLSNLTLTTCGSGAAKPAAALY